MDPTAVPTPAEGLETLHHQYITRSLTFVIEDPARPIMPGVSRPWYCRFVIRASVFDYMLSKTTQEPPVRSTKSASSNSLKLAGSSSKEPASPTFMELTDTIPDPRDIVIVALADGCGLIGHILSADELAGAVARIELVRQLDLIGRTFLNALDVAVQPAAGKLDREPAAPAPPTGPGNR